MKTVIWFWVLTDKNTRLSVSPYKLLPFIDVHAVVFNYWWITVCILSSATGNYGSDVHVNAYKIEWISPISNGQESLSIFTRSGYDDVGLSFSIVWWNMIVNMCWSIGRGLHHHTYPAGCLKKNSRCRNRWRSFYLDMFGLFLGFTVHICNN